MCIFKKTFLWEEIGGEGEKQLRGQSKTSLFFNFPIIVCACLFYEQKLWAMFKTVMPFYSLQVERAWYPRSIA